MPPALLRLACGSLQAHLTSHNVRVQTALQWPCRGVTILSRKLMSFRLIGAQSVRVQTALQWPCRGMTILSRTSCLYKTCSSRNSRFHVQQFRSFRLNGAQRGLQPCIPIAWKHVPVSTASILSRPARALVWGGCQFQLQKKHFKTCSASRATSFLNLEHAVSCETLPSPASITSGSAETFAGAAAGASTGEAAAFPRSNATASPGSTCHQSSNSATVAHHNSLPHVLPLPKVPFQKLALPGPAVWELPPHWSTTWIATLHPHRLEKCACINGEYSLSASASSGVADASSCRQDKCRFKTCSTSIATSFLSILALAKIPCLQHKWFCRNFHRCGCADHRHRRSRCLFRVQMQQLVPAALAIRRTAVSSSGLGV